jgi:ATP-binding cassette, subfamily B, multidrug efflux pump
MSEKREIKSRNNAGSSHRHGMPVEKAKDFKATFRRLVAYIGKNKTALLIVFIMAVGSTVFMILGPKMLGNATTTLAEGFASKASGGVVNFEKIARILMTVLILYVISAVLSYIQQYVMAGVSQKIIFNMRSEVKYKLKKLPLKYFDKNSHGDVLSRVTNDIDTISGTLQQSLTQIITSVATIIGVIYMMFTISWILAIVVIMVLPVVGLITKAIMSKSQIFFSKQQKILGNLNGHIEEMYSGHTVVKAFGKEVASIEKFDKVNEKLFDVGWKAQFLAGIMMPLMQLISNFSYVIICVVGGWLAVSGRITIGGFQAFIQYSRQFNQPIAQVAQIANIFQSTVAAAERVYEILDEKEEISDANSKHTLIGAKGKVDFNDICFGYDKDIPIIKHLNLNVKAGAVIAIVGPTGAGKTTLVNLLMRFYDIDAGEIKVDGIDIRDLKRSQLRDNFGMVLQNTWLFNGSIKDNIAYGKKGASFDAVIDAAKMARADGFIRKLPDGYDTILNEEASNISQGQKQLLTIARALLADPSILILDEATSSVDTRTEKYIQQGMIALMHGRTNFVIAHRLSTIKHADTILVMKDGEVIEQGNHGHLMEKDGFYAELYNSQFASA